ncbi:MAG: Gfo/Idh/MocA family oxidoreductase [Acidobacteria bacterium]|nr:Gfo/Idh/MocA family oxidoreductase [Acidobacteriota bacterium]
MSVQNLSRRRFFFLGSLLAGAVPSGGYGTVKSLKALGYKPYYDKLNVAAIGCGGRGGSILNDAARTENIVALCDVDEKRAAENFARYSKQPKYADFRVMLEKEGKNIDACTIGIPDHMHATAALACMQAGKHVYLEKPLTRTPWEARLMADAAKKYGVATQMGNQGYSHESIRVTSEILWSGEIGDVQEVHASSSPGTHPVGLDELPEESSVPADLDWDLWLGGADMRAYNSTFTPYNWRGYFDFGTGQLGNWGIHVLGPVNLALQLGAPTSVELLRQVDSSELTFPERAVLKYDFPARGKMPPVSVYWHDSPRPFEEEAYRVSGMEQETILPGSNNLSDKGRGPAPQPRGPGGPRRPRTGPPQGAGGPGVAVYGYERRGDAARPGVLSGNGAVFVGSKGMMATVARCRLNVGPTTSCRRNC